MRKLIAFTLLAICLCAVAISAKTTKLTPEEIILKDAAVEAITPERVWIDRIMNSKAFKNTDKRAEKHAKWLDKFRKKFRRGEVKCKRRVDGNWIEVIADVNDVEAATRLDRPWNSDPNMIEGILLHEIRMLDGIKISTRFGSDPNE